MADAIEIVSSSDKQGITELASAVLANAEPGFQIDGVDSLNGLLGVFKTLRDASPRKLGKCIRFDQAYLFDGSSGDRTELGAHIDKSYQGLAVHHNISDEVEVTLGTAVRWSRELLDGLDPSCFNDRSVVESVRRGITVKGRLTIFSEGNAGGTQLPFRGLKPTVHYFDRSKTSGPNIWARYSTAGTLLTRIVLPQSGRVKHRARKAFNLLDAWT